MTAETREPRVLWQGAPYPTQFPNDLAEVAIVDGRVEVDSDTETTSGDTKGEEKK